MIDALLPGKRLWMLSTGTGVAPFASLMREPESYEKFDKIILTQTCRLNSELEYGADLEKRLMEDPLVGEESAMQVHPLCNDDKGAVGENGSDHRPDEIRQTV